MSTPSRPRSPSRLCSALRLAGLGFALALTGCVATAWSRGVLSAGNQTTRAADGRLEGTRSLPPFGEGYRVYSVLGNALGRQYAHHAVIETLEAVLAGLHEREQRRHELAELGLRHGGPFFPHATHQEGLSVDVMTPMRDRHDHTPARLSTAPWALFGYCWHIDPESHRLSGMRWDVRSGPRVCPDVSFSSDKEVDFASLASLIEALDTEARARGGAIAFVIVDPSFVDPLREAGVRVRLSTRAWIAHDDHVHVEFRF